MVTKLKSQATRSLGLAFASFLVFTLLMSGSALAQAGRDGESEMPVKDEFLAEAHAAAAELGAEFGLSADDAAALVDTILFTVSDAAPGVNMRRMMADLSATYGLEPRELFGFLQWYRAELMAIGQDYGLVPARGARPAFGPRSADPAGSGPIGPRSRWQAEGEEWQYGPRGYRGMRPERGPAYGPGTEQPGTARADAMRYRFQQMHEEFHMRETGSRYGRAHGGSDTDMWTAAKQDRVNPKMTAWKAAQEYARHHAVQDRAAKSWDGSGHKDGMYDRSGGPGGRDQQGDIGAAKARWYKSGKEAGSIHFKRGGVEETDLTKRFMPEGAWHDGDGSGRRHGRPGDAEIRERFDKHTPVPGKTRYDTGTSDRMRGGQPDFMDKDGMDVSVEPLVGGFESDMMGLEHNVAAMIPVVLDVVGSTIVESLATSTGMPAAEMEAMVVQALLEGLDAAMNEGLITQEDAFGLLMLLTAADAMEQ